MICNLTNTSQSKNLSKAHLEILAHRLSSICPSAFCDLGTSDEGLVLHVTHKLDTNPAYVSKLMRSYATQYMYDLELRIPEYIHVHILTESGSTMLHCQHELTILQEANHEETSS